MTDKLDWPQEKIDALLSEYSESQDIDVTMQNMGKRIAELEQELALMKSIRPSQAEIDDMEDENKKLKLKINSFNEGAEALLEENERLKQELAQSERLREEMRKACESEANREAIGQLAGTSLIIKNLREENEQLRSKVSELERTLDLRDAGAEVTKEHCKELERIIAHQATALRMNTMCKSRTAAYKDRDKQ